MCEWSKLDQQDREQHERRPFPHIDQIELKRPLSPLGEMAYRAWSTLANGRQGGGLGLGNIAYSEIAFYLSHALGIEGGPLADRLTRLIYAADTAYQEAATPKADD